MTRTAPGARRLRRGLPAAGALAAGLAFATPAQARTAVPTSQPTVRLLGVHVPHTRPSLRAPRLTPVRARRPLTGVRTVLPDLGRRTSATGRRWVRVALPGRPNGSRGWITASRTRAGSTPWAITVKLRARLVTVYHLGRPVRRFRAIVGAPRTPTPRGRFFVEEALALRAGDAGGPYALATSARSDVLQEFEGGPGQIALHGRNHLPGVAGTAVSHGCIRLSSTAITWLSRRIGAGVPLRITRR